MVKDMKKKKYDIILWDVDGTLLDFHRSERWALEQVFSQYGMQIDDDIYRAFYEINLNYWKRLERREVTRAELLIGRFKDLFTLFKDGEKLHKKAIDYERLSQIEVNEFRLCYQENLGSVYFYFDDSISLCKKLKEEGFRQYIVSNGLSQVQNNKLHLAGFDTIMDDVFISETVGYDKPDKRFFDFCFREIFASEIAEKYELHRILIVGDSMTSDMKGAQNAGIDCCLYVSGWDGTKKAEAVTYQIAHLWNVEEIIWQNQKDKN